MSRRLAIVGALLLLAAPAMAAGRYSADRYDAHIEVLRGGTLRVTETIAIRFETGTFSQFYRAIPVRMTDGVEIVSASMDGQSMPMGQGIGFVQISGSSSVRVTWRFATTSASTHTFEISYLAHGVVRQEEGADVCAWRVLPTEHGYQIASSTTDIILPEASSTSPTVDVRRIGNWTVDADGPHVRIEANTIRGNGWLQAAVRLPRGSIIDAPPAWQQHEAEVARLSINWIVAAALVFLSGLALLFFVRQRYDAPPREFGTMTRWSTPPDTLPPVLAGTLVTNGTPRLEHAMAAMFSMADRGELRIDEQARILGQRHFAITHIRTERPMAPYEERLLEVIFGGLPDTSASVSLAKARGRLTRQFRRFSAALEPAMQSAGLLDEDRRGVRRRFAWISAACFIAVGVTATALALFVPLFGAWPMMIPLALALVGVSALISYAAHTPLSNEGVRRAVQWRGFRQYLREVARDHEPSPANDAVRQLLPFAVALGVAPAWSAYLKRHRSAAPDWFRAISATGDTNAAAFSVFVAYGGSGVGGGAYGSAGAAAGGGSSGAS